jgi:6-phospho-3-hexuloisomerase
MITTETNLGSLILSQVNAILEKTDYEDSEKLVDAILIAESIFLAGAGRSGLVDRFFAMRLMHLGLHPHLVGDTTTPALQGGDLLIAISNSGETLGPRIVMEKAKKIGATTVLITNANSTKSSMATIAAALVRLHVDDQLTLPLKEGEGINLAPMGTLFELAALVFLEGVIASIIHRKQLKEAELRKLHANLE